MSSQPSLDAVAFIGGRIYLGGGVTRRGGVAVRGGRILAVGDDSDVLEAVGADAQVFTIGDGLLSPAFGDAHLHPVSAGKELGQCDLQHARSAEESLSAIRAYAESHPDEQWILGAGWSVEHFADGMPLRTELDHIVPDRPVFLLNRDHHGAWVNSLALALAGITRDTPDPADGRIERDAHGDPNGVLQEGATRLVSSVAPKADRETLHAGLVRAQAACFELGITHWQDAMIRDHSPEIDGLTPYLDAVDRGTLKATVNGAIWWDRHRGADQLEGILDLSERAKTASADLRFDAVKIMVDGVAENFTASMTLPYRDACGHSTDNYGLSFLSDAGLQEVVADIDRHGLQAHFHALGDRAVRSALDAVEHARKRNPAGLARHHLAHLQVVQAVDVARFAPLRALANVQPLWACADEQMETMTIPFIDPELVDRHYPFADMLNSGAKLAAGSDWPVSSLNPLEGMHVAVNRTPVGVQRRPFIADQRISLGAIWDAYTSGVAYLNGRETELGSLRAGMNADLVLLDRNPFESPESMIADTRVVGTWVKGMGVYGTD